MSSLLTNISINCKGDNVSVKNVEYSLGRILKNYIKMNYNLFSKVFSLALPTNYRGSASYHGGNVHRTMFNRFATWKNFWLCPHAEQGGKCSVQMSSRLARPLG